MTLSSQPARGRSTPAKAPQEPAAAAPAGWSGLPWPLYLFLLALAACQGASAALPAPAPERLPVRLSPVDRGPVERPVRAAGLLRLKGEADLSFKAGGVVLAVLVQEGEAVRRGQVLARLDATEVEAGLAQARAAEAKAARDLGRAEELRASGTLPLADLQNAQTGAAVARAAAQAAAFNARLAVVTAPDDGVVARRAVEPGEIVAAGRPVLRLSGRAQGLVVRAGLPDRDALLVSVGDRAEVTVDAVPGQVYAARVSQVAGVASPGSGTFDVEVRLDGAPRGLLSGLTAKVAIAHREHPQASIPLSALVPGPDGQVSVFTVREGRAQRVPVEVGFLAGERAAIVRGLESVARVVSAGAQSLVEHAEVREAPEAGEPRALPGAAPRASGG